MAVIDPGGWSESEALRGANVVLATHEHSDHIDPQMVADFSGGVYVPAGAKVEGLEVVNLNVGDRVELGGFTVEAVGGLHAPVVAHQETCVNIGYIIDDLVYHPGDALHVPDRQIDTLFVPIQASWLKTAEAIDFVNRVAPRQAFGMHEGQVNERGVAILNHWLAQECRGVYRWLAAGETVTFDPPK